MIESRQNERFKKWSSLLTSRGIKKHGEFLLFGEKVIEEAKVNHADRIVEAIIPGQSLNTELFNEIDIFGIGHEILVLKTKVLPVWDPSSKNQALLIPLGDPSNLGAALRSAAAFGMDEIVLLEEAANPFHPRSVRAASGTLLKSKLTQGPSIHTLGKIQNLYALDMNGTNISTIDWPTDAKLLVGEEGPGIPSELDAVKVSIAMKNSTESLNATTALSIALYEMGKNS